MNGFFTKLFTVTKPDNQTLQVFFSFHVYFQMFDGFCFLAHSLLVFNLDMKIKSFLCQNDAVQVLANDMHILNKITLNKAQLCKF